MIVATKDVVLVAPQDRAQEIKELLSLVEGSHRQIANNHTCVPRPWGTYENIAHGTNFQVKHIIVKAGRSLSLQMHHHRAEHWIVVSGTARITRNDEVFLLSENQSTYIPIGTRHRIENPGMVPLHNVEVQSGSYLGEDDIVRFDDRYGREGTNT